MCKIYLLVQYNIQTGPFTLKELLQQSLQLKSMIWVIGQSKEWFSPSEIPRQLLSVCIKSDKLRDEQINTGNHYSIKETYYLNKLNDKDIRAFYRSKVRPDVQGCVL